MTAISCAAGVVWVCNALEPARLLPSTLREFTSLKYEEYLQATVFTSTILLVEFISLRIADDEHT